MFRLDGRVAVITGGASGIGLATARRIAAAGAIPVLADVVDATELAASIGGAAIVMDVADEDQVAAVMRFAIERYGRLDIVFNNAGVALSGGGTLDADADLYRRSFEINTLGVLYGMKHAAPHMARGGVIVNTSSMAGLIGFPEFGCYSASKWAVVGLTKNAAIEFAPLGIRVLAIAPSAVNTPMYDRTDPDLASEAGFVELVQLSDRPIEADEVAAAVHFLVSDDCAHLTGTVLPLDGGYLAGPSLALLEVAARQLG